MTTVEPQAVVYLLDDAANAAWDARYKDQAIRVAWSNLTAGTPGEAKVAFKAWADAVGYEGTPNGFRDALCRRYRDKGDIALSLMRAAATLEQMVA